MPINIYDYSRYIYIYIYIYITVYYSIWYWYTVIRLVKIDLLVPTKVNY